MALGIYKDGIYSIFTIPLEWETNDIVANHFRMLADALEETPIDIVSIGLVTEINNEYGKPYLEVRGFERK